MEEIKNFFIKFRGAIIGALVAIVVLCTGFYQMILGIILIGMGIYAGNYIQQNKDEVKDRIKTLIDKL